MSGLPFLSLSRVAAYTTEAQSFGIEVKNICSHENAALALPLK